MRSYKIDNSGRNFEVHIYEDFGYVLKYPKTDKYKNSNNLKKLVSVHNYLSKNIKEILPCKMYKNSAIQMPLAEGKRCDILLDEMASKKNKNLYFNFKNRVDLFVGSCCYRCEELGYLLNDLRYMNIFYSFKDDKFYVIDIDSFKKVKGGKLK